jgi:hypothetical protein
LQTLDELSKKVDRLERQQHGSIHFFFQYLVSPLLLLIIGFILNQNVEQAKQSFQNLELEVKRIEAAQSLLNELFSDIPERAFIADRLMTKLVDEGLSKEISSIITQYYSQRFKNDLSMNDMAGVEKIAAAAKAIGGPAAESITKHLQMQRYYVIVASIKPINERDAIIKAKTLREKGYDSEIYYSTSDYLAVTIGNQSFSKANTLRKKAFDNGDAPSDSYLTTGVTFTERLYPR